MASTAVPRITSVLFYAIALLPLFALPGVSVPSGDLRGMIGALCLGIGALALGSVALISKKKVTVIPSFHFLSALPLLALSLLSTGTVLLYVYAGTSFEVATVGSLALFALTMSLGSLLPKDSIRYILALSAFAVLLFFAVAAIQGTGSSDAAPTPSARVTQLVMATSYLEGPTWNTLFGTAEPYAYSWYRYHPLEINTSPLWAVEPHGPGATSLAIALRWGIVGFVAYMGIFVALTFSAVSLFRRTEHRSVAITAHAYAGALLVYTLFFEADTAVFIASALATSSAIRLSAPHEPAVPRRAIVAAGGVALLFFGLLLSSVAVRQFFAAEFYARAEQGGINSTTQIQYLQLAVRAWPTSDYAVAASKAVYEHEFATVAPTEQNRDALLDALRRATEYAGTARIEGRRDFNVWVYGASLHIALMRIGYPDAAANAQDAVAQSLLLGPKRPEPHYLQALLAAQLGKDTDARASAERSLTFKPDYAEAQLLLRSLDAPTPPVVVPSTQ